MQDSAALLNPSSYCCILQPPLRPDPLTSLQDNESKKGAPTWEHSTYLSYWLESRTVWVYTHLYSMEKRFDNIGGAVSEAEWDPDRTNKSSSERKSSCHQSLLFVWTQSQVKISFSFLLLIQEKLGGSEMQITVIKKNTWQRNMDAMCQCAIVSNLETLQKDQRSNNIVTWSKWRTAANGRVGSVMCWKNLFWFPDDCILEPFLIDSF